jgi:hypothetical protein
MRHAGLDQPDPITPTNVSSAMSATSSIIAIHYDFTNYGGSSLAVSGSACTGGYINFRTHYTSWNDRISSTIHGCGSKPITHWDNAPSSGGNCSGSKSLCVNVS